MNDYQLIAGAIRALSMDAVEKAKSGHSGAPMGMADMATVLWRDHLKLNPKNPKWDNRDRFVLSNGHASMLLYAIEYLSGFDLSLEDLKNFRQMGSKTPGHPEFHDTPGVETTTGPLGQGISNAVGFALAEAHLAQKFNRDGFNIVDHHTYCFLGDGCLMEGVVHESCALAGTLGLGKLIALYDSNGISIDGEIEPWFGEDVKKRFEGYGWQVIGPIDGHDPNAINQAINEAKAQVNQPSLIICKTVIGFGSPKLAGTEKVHGAPLGADEILASKQALGLPLEPFSIPQGAKEAADLTQKGADLEQQWQALFVEYSKHHPDLAKEYTRVMKGALPEHLDTIVNQALKQLQQEGKTVATRKASEMALDILAPHLPELMGGSADLTSSNLTWSKESVSILPHQFAGNYVHYGVREFAMSAMMNGMSLHGGLRPYGGTFLVFSDYMRNGMRMSSLMQLPVVYVLTHDSIGLGEDGPTHQPIEQISSLRLMPNMQVWRPCDSVETLVAWRMSLNDTTPSALALSRQGLPVQPRDEAQIVNIAKGGYILKAAHNPDLCLIATGSEVALAMQAAEVLEGQGRKVQVVSMPCLDIFLEQDEDYRHHVLAKGVKKIAIETGASLLWQGIVGDNGKVIGIDRFGLSAPAEQLFEFFGMTVDHIVKTAVSLD